MCSASSRDLVYRVHAFTADPQEGNPAGVVPRADHLDGRQMQSIAKAMGLSETAFILPSSRPQCRLRLRWFTPITEVPLCGHATMAALSVLTDIGILSADGRSHLVETLSGALKIRIEKTRQGQVHWLEVPVPRFRQTSLDLQTLYQLFALKPEDLKVKLPAVRDEVGQGLYVPVDHLEVLRGLNPEFARMRSSKQWGRVCFFTQETVEPANTWHCRFFAPAFGIDEDPVTGAINGPLGAYHRLYARPDDPEEVEYVGEQGDFIGCRGRVRVRAEAKSGEIRYLEIGGQAIIVEKIPLSSMLGR